jgi:PPOX class probable F420-dependent enzyme
MAKAREKIRMTPEEVDDFLHGRHSMAVATLGADGRPHVVAMWYGFLDGVPAFETYRKSQKVVNLRRDARMTCLIEEGDRYDELRGVELVGTGTIVDDPEALVKVARSLFERYDTGFGPDQGDDYIAFMVAKRVVVRVDVDEVVSWDHGKLIG